MSSKPRFPVACDVRVWSPLLMTATMVLLTPAASAEQQLVPQAAQGGQVVYRDAPAAEWSDDRTFVAPGNGSKFHGPFPAQPVALTVDRLPAHTWLRLRFQLCLIGTWDGSSRVWGPDLWSLQVRGGNRLVFGSFSNMGMFSNNNRQSFPDDFPWGRNPAGTGAGGRDVLEIPKDGRDSTESFMNDSVYAMDLVFPHSGDSLTLDFAGIFDDSPVDGQAWGVGDVEVVTLADPPPVGERELAQLWDLLADADPMRANEALWLMVSGGERTLDFIAARIDGMEPVTGEEGVRMHRAHKVCRIIGGKRGHHVSRSIDPLLAEHRQDIEDMR